MLVARCVSQDVAEMLSEFDEDGNGVITGVELRKGAEALRVTKKSVWAPSPQLCPPPALETAVAGRCIVM